MRNAINNLFFFVLTFTIVADSFACSVCSFGEPGDKSNTALRLSVLTLLIILCGVLAAVIRFLIIFNKRLKMLEKQGI